MSCCGGQKRKQSLILAYPQFTVIYLGSNPTYKVQGSMTRQWYRFRGQNFQVKMDKRDWDSMQDPMLKRIL